MVQIIYGENTYLVAQARKRWVERAGDAINRIDAVDVTLDDIKQVVQAVSMFDPEPKILLNEPSKNKLVADSITDLLKLVPNETNLLIVEQKLDKRQAYYKAIRKHDGATEYKNITGPDLIVWIEEEVSARKMLMNRQTITYFIEYVGEDQWLLSQELDKLRALEHKISKEDITRVCVQNTEHTIFEMLDAMSNNSQRSKEILEGLIDQRVEPIYISTMVTWMLHNLGTVLYAGDVSPQVIAGEAKMSPYTVRNISGLAHRISKQHYAQMLEAATDVDLALKSTSTDRNMLIRSLLDRLQQTMG